MRIFISHSTQDHDLAEALILLLRSALSLSTEEIRCSSVDGYRLPVGANTDEKIRREVYECEVLIGLLTPASIASPYVLFELGARWGAGMDIAPVVCRGAHVAMLRGPLKSLNSLEGSVETQVHQLLFDVARALDLQSSSPAAYYKQLKDFVKESQSEVQLGIEIRQRVTTPRRLRSAFLVGCALGNRIGILPIGEGAHREFGEFVDALVKLKISGPASDGLRVFASDQSPFSASVDLPVDTDPEDAAEEFQRRFPNERVIAQALKELAGLLTDVEDEVTAELSNFEIMYYKLGQLLYRLAIGRFVDKEAQEPDDHEMYGGELIALTSLIEVMSAPSFLIQRLSEFVALASDPTIDSERLWNEASNISVALYALLDVLADLPPAGGLRMGEDA